MENAKHEWCRDTARDEAVRAAEDAAAVPSIQHRDLPDEVAELRERVARLESLIPKSVSPSSSEVPENKGDTMPADGLRTERVTLEIVYDQRFWHEPSTWAWNAVLKGRTKTVRVVEEADTVSDEAVAQGVTLRERTPGEAAAYAQGMAATVVADLMRERDAARAECERLRARVAELEAEEAAPATTIDRRGTHEAAGATVDRAGDDRAGIHYPQHSAASGADGANAAGDRGATVNGMRTERVTLEFRIEGSPPTQWPWSYILRRSDAIKMRPGESVRVVEETEAMKCMTKLRRERDAARAERERLRDRVAELEAAAAAPPEPRGWLTEEERRAVEFAAKVFRGHTIVGLLKENADQLDALLARESPPLVRRPKLQDHLLPQAQRDRDDVWITAIRAAGGEVDE